MEVAFGWWMGARAWIKDVDPLDEGSVTWRTVERESVKVYRDIEDEWVYLAGSNLRESHRTEVFSGLGLLSYWISRFTMVMSCSSSVIFDALASIR